ncbi:MAG: DUF1566 domain-containing protein, partial [Pseudomonadota bacterium]
TYTTGAISANCTVTASFSLNSYSVTPSAGDNGSISPATAQTVNHGDTVDFTIEPDADYGIEAVTGTCGGSLADNTYTTAAVNADCTVAASFALPAPPDLVATAGDEVVGLSWTAVTGATDYCVYVSENAGIHPDTAASYDDLGCGIATASHMVADLTNDTAYYFVVTASDGSKESAASNEVSATPAAPITATGKLNDTGIDWCADADTNHLECTQENFPGQDGDHGRDADTELVKVGAGHAGFDFTKLDASGIPLADQGTDYPTSPWACVQDNHTGLMWEVKVDDDESMHHKDHTFSWYNSDSDTNGGLSGLIGGGFCNGTVAGGCDTEKFVAAVNAAGFCGHDDWRLPARKELITLVNSGIASPGPTIDLDYFPNTPSEWFWSSSPWAAWDIGAWGVNFDNGRVASLEKKLVVHRARLVRAGQ